AICFASGKVQGAPFIDYAGSNGTDTNPYVLMFDGTMYIKSNTYTTDPNGRVWNLDSPLFGFTRPYTTVLTDVQSNRDRRSSPTPIPPSPLPLHFHRQRHHSCSHQATVFQMVRQSPIDDLVSAVQSIVLSVGTADEFVRTFEMQYANERYMISPLLNRPLNRRFLQRDISEIV
ncbi:hypothetical protein FRC15_006503, partial [Serendipita sp. 397]